MARVLDRTRAYVEVVGEVDPNEKDKEGKSHVPHRYRQFGMMFDDAGELIGQELPVPADDETEVQMRARLTVEIREQVMKEFREKNAEAAKSGGDMLDELENEPQRNLGGRPRKAA